jgi:predicted glutamine amidotransferase
MTTQSDSRTLDSIRGPISFREMCEQYVAIADAPFRLDELWAFTERLEHYGIAGFGWGATWLADDGELHSYRDLGSFGDDAGREAVGRTSTRAVLVHLRRPSRFSTIGPADTQPFDDPDGRFAFSHNGDLERHRDHRDRYRAAGRIHGKADTEVGARWLEDEWDASASAPDALSRLHDTFGGHANLAVLTRDGAAHHYAGNDENPVFTFDLGRIHLASTGMYSLDRSVFKYVAPASTNRSLVRLSETASLP